jgi:hypothetical protein
MAPMRSASGIFEGHGWDLKNGIFFKDSPHNN